MMRRYLLAVLAPATLGIGLTGCATEDPMVYDTHRRVVQLEERLNSLTNEQTTSDAGMVARMDAVEQNVAKLSTSNEDRGVEIEALQRELQSLKKTVYDRLQLSTGAAAGAASNEVKTGPVTIEGPTGTTLTVTPTTTPGPTSMTVEPEPEMESLPSNTTVASATPPPAPAPAPAPVESVPVASAPAPTGGDPQVYYQAAQKSYASDNFQQALQQFDDFLQRYPGSELSANAQFWKAKSHLKLGDYQPAIGEFQKLVNNYPNSTKVPYAIHNQAVAHSNLGQIPEAVRLMEKVVSEFPLSPAADQAKLDLKQLQGG